MAAVTQVRREGPGAAYYAKQLAAGKTVKEALRLLRRRISDRVFRALLADETARVSQQPIRELPQAA
jgi:transposase